MLRVADAGYNAGMGGAMAGCLLLERSTLALALAGADSPLAPHLEAPVGRDGDGLREHGLLDQQGQLTAIGAEWFAPLREPSYVFRIERSALDVVATLSYYVHLPSLRSLRVAAEADGTLTLTEHDVPDVIYAGLIDALGIWPDTHPEIVPGAQPPDVEAAVETTLVVLRREGDGIVESELAWIDADENGVWRVTEDGLEPSTDHALYQSIPLLLALEDR